MGSHLGRLKMGFSLDQRNISSHALYTTPRRETQQGREASAALPKAKAHFPLMYREAGISGTFLACNKMILLLYNLS